MRMMNLTYILTDITSRDEDDEIDLPFDGPDIEDDDRTAKNKIVAPSHNEITPTKTKRRQSVQRDLQRNLQLVQY